MIPLTNVHETQLCRAGPDLVRAGVQTLIAADLAIYPTYRAQALSRELGRPAVLVDASAVYVHTGIWIMNPLSYRMVPCAPLPGRSTRWTTDRRLLKAEHVMDYGNAVVTTPVRTLADLVWIGDIDLILAALAAYGPATPPMDELRACMGQRFRGTHTDSRLTLVAELVKNRTWIQ